MKPSERVDKSIVLAKELNREAPAFAINEMVHILDEIDKKIEVLQDMIYSASKASVEKDTQLEERIEYIEKHLVL